MKTPLIGNVHLVAGAAAAIPGVLSLLRSGGVRTEGNPDVYVREYKSFGIDDAIELRDRSNRRAIAEDRRYFVVATPGMTHEAQNALLKTLEESAADAAFFIITPAPEMLLSTLRSRAQTLSVPREETGQEIDAKAFLAAPAPKRLDMLKPLLEKDDDEKRDLGKIVAFLSSLEKALEKEPEGLRAACRGGLEPVYRARKYIGDKGALVKPLLEQVALLIPKV